jgi:predicted  nucleic acid-binding Zn-ribbon protein
MPGPAVVFREIHRLRQNADQLQSEIERLPRQQKAQQNKVARQEEIHKEAQDALKHLKVGLLEKESGLKTTHNLIAKHEKQLGEAKVKKEYDALKVELAVERKKATDLEEAILAGMSQVEEDSAKLPDLAANIKKAKDEAAAFAKDMQARQANLEEQLAAARKELAQIEQGLSEDARALYERLAASRGPDALAPVKDRNCVSCYTGLTAQDYNNLLAERLVACKSCGRLLYLAE